MGLIKITPADKWFSLAVRERAGWQCQRCGQQYAPPTQALHCCHWHSRGNWSVRFDPSNAIAMDMGCHLYTQRERDEHRKLMVQAFGELEIDRLQYDKGRPANGIKRHLPAIAAHYRKEVERLQKLRDEGVTGRLDIQPWDGA
jgi:hypothetical protein